MTPERIAAELRSELMTGALGPGAELSQVVLAERFGVSRIPIRDALRILAGEGLVEIQTNRGAKAIALSAGEVREIYDLRVLLECDCLRRSAENMTIEALEDIERVRRKSDLDAGTPAWAAGDWAFHSALYQRAERPRQIAMIEALRRACQLHVNVYSAMPIKTPRWLDEHRIIVGHLRNNEMDQAVAALREHLEATAQHLLGLMAAAKR
jgi:DNA-binding GntR family transcriptional regulator